MKSHLILIITVISFSCFGNLLKAQASVKLYHNEEVESSEKYRQGNIYQKDFLLFIEMLKTTHPLFVVQNQVVFNVDSLIEAGYSKLASCSSKDKCQLYLTSIASLLMDGHTYVQFNLDRNGLFYLFQIAIDFPDVYLVSISKEHESVLGEKITHLNNVAVWDVINSFRWCMSSDNDMYCYARVGQYMQWLPVWEENPFIMPDSSLVISFSDGEEITLYPQPLPKNMTNIATWKVEVQAYNTITQPQKLPFFYTLLETESICYFQFNQCVDNSTVRYQDHTSGKKTPKKELDQKLMSFPRFDTLVAQMFKIMQKKNIQTLVVDVRHNGGGNSILCNMLLSYTKLENLLKSGKTYIRISPFWKEHYPSMYNEIEKILVKKNQSLEMGKLYLATDLSFQKKNTATEKMMVKYFKYNKEVANIFSGNVIFIQGKNTYSSAGLLLINAVDNGIGQIIGEKSLYKPCNYGDILAWELPNTKIQGGVSHKIFNRPDESKCTEPYLTPNVLIERHWDSQWQDGDSCWDWIIEHYSKENIKQ
jgi:hypothetical protein